MSRLDALRDELKKPTPTADDWNRLGCQYHNAVDGKTRDYEKANLCYLEALRLDSNHDHANYNLGQNYRLAQGATKDLVKAKTYYEKAAVNGHPDAKLRLLEMEMAETKPTPTADDWNHLGFQYHNAVDGKTRDYEKANLCYLEALRLDSNHDHANYNLGQNYRLAQGATKDLVKAKTYYEKAAVNGHPDAKLRLLKMEMAETKPTPTADDWNHLGFQYHNDVDGKTRDYEKANLCYQKALTLDPKHANANYGLGLLYQSGYGVIKNTTEAKKFFQNAQDNGHYSAREKIVEIEDNEGPGLVRTKLLPKILKNETLTKAEEKLCIENKKVIVDSLMTTYKDDLGVFTIAANPHTPLSRILATHRKSPQLFNLFHRALTNSAVIVMKQHKTLKKEICDRKKLLQGANTPAVVVGVPVAPAPKVVEQAKQSTGYRPQMFFHEQPDPLAEAARENYAKLFNECAHQLYPKKNVAKQQTPLNQLQEWVRALTSDEKKIVLEQARLRHVAEQRTAEELRALLNSVQLPETGLPLQTGTAQRNGLLILV